MTNRQTIYIRVYPTAGKPSYFDAYREDQHLCCSRTPFVSSARQLLGSGVRPDTLLIMRHGDSPQDAMMGIIGSLARFDVREDAKSGPRFVRYRPNPFAGKAPNGQRKQVQADAFNATAMGA